MTQTPRQLHFHLVPILCGEYKPALCLCAAAAANSHLEDMSWFFFFMCGISFVAHILMPRQWNRLLLLLWFSLRRYFQNSIKKKWGEGNRRIPFSVQRCYRTEQCAVMTCLWSGVCGLDVAWGMKGECALWRGSAKHLKEQRLMCQK